MTIFNKIAGEKPELGPFLEYIIVSASGFFLPSKNTQKYSWPCIQRSCYFVSLKKEQDLQNLLLLFSEWPLNKETSLKLKKKRN